LKAQHVSSASEVLGYVREAFGARLKETARTEAVWADVLEGVDERWLFEAAREICRTSTGFAPTPGMVRTLAEHLQREHARAEAARPVARVDPPPLTPEQRARFRAGIERVFGPTKWVDPPPASAVNEREAKP
jgi:hypothetical protein